MARSYDAWARKLGEAIERNLDNVVCLHVPARGLEWMLTMDDTEVRVHFAEACPEGKLYETKRTECPICQGVFGEMVEVAPGVSELKGGR